MAQRRALTPGPSPADAGEGRRASVTTFSQGGRQASDGVGTKSEVSVEA
jgi:hypothetical protein